MGFHRESVMSQSANRWLSTRPFLAPAFVTSLLMGCGGGSSSAPGSTIAPPAATTRVTLLLSSTDHDRVVQAKLTLNSLTLVNAAGDNIPVLSAAQSAEFVHLNGVVESLVTVTVPQDRYTSASATLGTSGFGCVVLGSAGGISAGSYSTVAAAPTITLPEPIVVAGSPMAQVLNLVISPSQANAACDGLAALQAPTPTETITPAFNLTVYDGKETGLIGMIASITADGSGFSVAASDGPTWSVTTNDMTVFQGVAGSAMLAAGMPVNFDAALQSDGSLLASRVEVADTNTADLTTMRGASIFLSTAQPEIGLFITESAGALFEESQALGPWWFGFAAGTRFQVSAQMSNLQSLPFSPAFNIGNVVAGQSVYLSTHAAQFPDAPDLLEATTVTLVPQTINGMVSAVSGAGSFNTYTVALATYDPFAALARQSGQTTILANPATVVVYADGNTRMLNAAPLAVGSLLRFSGLVFNDNGTLRMDCAQVSDGVAL
jgi:hypothetical protein